MRTDAAFRQFHFAMAHLTERHFCSSASFINCSRLSERRIIALASDIFLEVFINCKSDNRDSACSDVSTTSTDGKVSRARLNIFMAWPGIKTTPLECGDGGGME